MSAEQRQHGSLTASDVRANRERVLKVIADFERQDSADPYLMQLYADARKDLGVTAKQRPLPRLTRFASQAHGDLTVARNYQHERPPLYRPVERLIERIRRKPSVPILHFVRQVEKLLEHSPESESSILFETLLDTALNLWSLRQEMTGEQDTIQVVNALEWVAANNQFDLQIQALRQKLFTYPEWVPWSHRQGYADETNQVLRRVEQSSQQLSTVDFTRPKEEVKAKLLALGFHEVEMPLTPGLLRHFPSLRSSIHTFEELEILTSGSHTARFWVAPDRIISGSAPHWLHSKGATTFLWASDLLLSIEGDHPEAAVVEHGKFSYTKLPTLLEYLAFGHEDQMTFGSRHEVLEYLNTVKGFTDIPPITFLNLLIEEIGNFIPAKPFDSQVTLGKFPIASFMKEIEKIYRFEWNRIAKDPRFKKGMYERLLYLADQVKQLVADNTVLGLAEIVEGYKSNIFADLATATNPGHARLTLREIGMTINPGSFGKVFDWSMFDCIAGTPTSLLMQANSLFGEVSLSLSPKQMELLNTYSGKKRPQNREDLRKFCQAFGKDPELFDTWGKCSMCRQKTFIWSTKHIPPGCDACVVCEVNDDLSRLGGVSDADGNPVELPQKSASLTDAIFGFSIDSLSLGEFPVFAFNSSIFKQKKKISGEKSL